VFVRKNGASKLNPLIFQTKIKVGYQREVCSAVAAKEAIFGREKKNALL